MYHCCVPNHPLLNVDVAFSCADTFRYKCNPKRMASMGSSSASIFVLYRAHGEDFYISVHFSSKPDTFEIPRVGQIATSWSRHIAVQSQPNGFKGKR